MLIAHLANNRNPHIAMLALTLLDTLVQSCGYPFHLQISTKEFLNELVRRFPERPPPFPNAIMSRILELINRWKEGICTESRWKDDLGNIRDMHRLLTFKGYRFRDLPRRQQQENLASASVGVTRCAVPLFIEFPCYCRISRPRRNWKMKIVRPSRRSYRNLFVEAPHAILPPPRSL